MFDVNRYNWSLQPDPAEALINALELKHGMPVTKTAWDNWEEVTEKRRLVLSAGSSTILHAVGLATIREKAEMVQAQPAYFDTADVWRRFKEEEQADIKVQNVRLTRDYRHNLNAMFDRINDNTTIVVITNPNNPTSTVVDHDALADFVQSVPKHVTVFIDEAYIDYAADPGYRDAVHLALEHENVLVSRTFSKVYGLGGNARRLRRALARDKKETVALQSGRSPERAWRLRRCSRPWMTTPITSGAKRTVAEGKNFLGRSFDRLGIEYVPSDSCFVLFNLKRDIEPVFNGLMERNVWIADAQWWGLKEHLRVTVGTQDENEAFVNTLEAVL